MGTVKRLLDTARADLGYKENPAGSNKTKFGVRMGLNGSPWCMSAVQCWCEDAGVALPVKTGSCGALMRAAQKAGMWFTSGFHPGDIAIYDFPGGAETDHTGIIESVTATSVIAIEGNTGAGNDANGGEVQRRTRKLSLVKGIVRPEFESEEEMTQDQFNAFMDKWLQSRIQTAPATSSAEAREWAEANGLITGYSDGTKRYKAYCTREQIAILLYRFHQKFIAKR